MAHIASSDAVVAIRSLPRRFTEVLSGPPGDDAWDRIVRAETGSPPRSALAWAAAAGALMAGLADVLEALPHRSSPSLDLRDEAASSYRPDPATSVADVLAALRAVATRAADALAARRPEDGERTVVVDGRPRPLDDVVSQLVTEATGAIRRAAEAVEAATR